MLYAHGARMMAEKYAEKFARWRVHFLFCKTAGQSRGRAENYNMYAWRCQGKKLKKLFSFFALLKPKTMVQFTYQVGT